MADHGEGTPLPLVDLNNSSLDKDNLDREDLGLGDDAGNTDRFLPCWVLFLVRPQTIYGLHL